MCSGCNNMQIAADDFQTSPGHASVTRPRLSRAAAGCLKSAGLPLLIARASRSSPMLKSTRRTVSTTLDAPVVVHAGRPEHVGRDQVLRFLDQFVADKENQLTVGADASADVHLSSALAQLKRIQRDCQGLPPTVLDEEPKQ